MENQYRPWEHTGQTEVEYWKARFLEQCKEPPENPDRRLVVEATQLFCECGGAGPDEGCTACKIYHAIFPEGA